MINLMKLLAENTSNLGSFHITFNEPKTYSRTLQQELDFLPDVYDFISEEDKALCIATDTIYSLHWYKDTQVGFIKLNGSTFEIVQKQVEEMIKEIYS